MFCKVCKKQIGFTTTICPHCKMQQYPYAWEIQKRQLPNTEENIILKARDTAQRAILISLDFIRNNEQKYEILTKEKERLDVAWLIMCFFAHIAVRQIANKLNSEHLEQLFLEDLRNKLIMCLYALCGHMSGLEINKKIDELAEFDLRYRKYNWASVDKKGYKDTVFWEFDNELASLLGYPKDLATLMALEVDFNNYFKDFDIRQLLKI